MLIFTFKNNSASVPSDLISKFADSGSLLWAELCWLRFWYCSLSCSVGAGCCLIHTARDSLLFPRLLGSNIETYWALLLVCDFYKLPTVHYFFPPSLLPFIYFHWGFFNLKEKFGYTTKYWLCLQHTKGWRINIIKICPVTIISAILLHLHTP